MNKRAFVLDVVNNTLTLSADFVDAMNDPTNAEYQLVCQFQHDFPNLRVVRKTHSTPTRYHNSDGSITTYQKNKKLTYKRMERFLNALPDGAEYLTAYWELREKADDMCASPYAAVSAWFMKQFPQFRSNPLFYLYNKPAIIPISTVIEAAKAKKSPSVVKIEGETKMDA